MIGENPGGTEKTKTQGDIEGLEGKGGAAGVLDLGEGMGLADLSGVSVTQDDGGTGGSRPEGWRVEAQQEIHKSEAKPEQRLKKEGAHWSLRVADHGGAEGAGMRWTTGFGGPSWS